MKATTLQKTDTFQILETPGRADDLLKLIAPKVETSTKSIH